MAALGAYMGPDQTLGGVPAVLIVVLLAIIVRRHAVRADATLGKSKPPHDWHRLIEGWPFPLEDPPPRRVVRGYMLSAMGIVLIVVGFLGAGLTANGVVWPILLFSGVLGYLASTGQIILPPGLEVIADPRLMAATPSVLVTIVLAISSLVIGVLIGGFALSAGPRLRDRGRRLRARDARFLLQRPGEQPVLLLRSFEDEELVDARPLSASLSRSIV